MNDLDLDRAVLLLGDCRERLKILPDASVDSVVSDPPYELGFMGKKWDGTGIAYSVELWREVLRVLKPGGYLLAFGGTRTYHRMACAIEDAGFEIRDSLHWMYGVGFPKSLNVCKALQDKGLLCGCEALPEHDLRGVPAPDVSQAESAAEREGQVLLPRVPQHGAPTSGRAQPSSAVRGGQPGLEGRRDVQAEQGQLHRTEVRQMPTAIRSDGAAGRVRDGAPADRGAGAGQASGAGRGRPPQGPQPAEQHPEQPGTVPGQRGPQTCGGCGKTRAEWVEGIGTALKPAHEPIVLARKTLIGTVAANVMEHGTGGLNIDACRIEGRERTEYGLASSTRTQGSVYGAPSGSADFDASKGRWPANVLFSHSEDCAAPGCAPGCPVAELDAQSGQLAGRGNKGVSVGRAKGSVRVMNSVETFSGGEYTHDRGGGASRFFYVSKPSRKERDLGCDALPQRSGGEATDREDGSAGVDNPRAGAGRTGGARNYHPTVKPIELMRYLVRLVTPPGGIVLDPFTGSGTTGIAALREGCRFFGVEASADYFKIGCARLTQAHDVQEAA